MQTSSAHHFLVLGVLRFAMSGEEREGLRLHGEVRRCRWHFGAYNLEVNHSRSRSKVVQFSCCPKVAECRYPIPSHPITSHHIPSHAVRDGLILKSEWSSQQTGRAVLGCLRNCQPLNTNKRWDEVLHDAKHPHLRSCQGRP